MGGCGMWQSLRDIQCGRAGLRPAATSTLRDEGGDFCKGSDDVLSSLFCLQHHNLL